MKSHFYLDTSVYWKLGEHNDLDAMALLKRNRRILRLTASPIIDLRRAFSRVIDFQYRRGFPAFLIFAFCPLSFDLLLPLLGGFQL